MKKRFTVILVLLGLFWGATACSPAQEPSTPTPLTADTAVSPPTSPPTLPPTNTPPPTDIPALDPITGYTTFQNEVMGISFTHPDSWVIHTDEINSNLLLFNSQATAESATLSGAITMITVIGADDIGGSSPTALIDMITQSFQAGSGIMVNAEQMTEIEAFSIGEQAAAKAEFRGEMATDGSPAALFITGIANGERTAGVLGFVSLPYAEAIRPVLADIVDTIVLSKPIVEEYDTSMYAVAEYDPERDPEEDTAVALTQAQSEGKRVLLMIGGDWCIDCRVLEQLIG